MKCKYAIDKDNRLIITKDSRVLRPHGYFVIEADNELAYIVKETAEWRKRFNIPQRLVLNGIWNLDRGHNLNFTLRKTVTQAGNDRLVIKNQIVKAKADSLIFSFGTQGKAGTHTFRLLQLKGKWQADKYNRLQFLVKRLKSRSDTLTLQAGWQARNNNLIYTYKKVSLKTKHSHLSTILFKGYWQVDSKNRLSYILDAKSDSKFEFKVYLETPSLIGKTGVIKYRAGIGVKGSRFFKAETITLYGIWKFHRKAGLSLEIDYGRRRVKTMDFGVFVRPGRGKVTCELKTRTGRDVGISIEFSRQFLKKDAEWFLRLVQDKGQSGFKWGVNIPW